MELQSIISSAKAQYAIASESERKMLESIFGESIKETTTPVKSGDITERVYNLETACIELGKDINTLFGNETSPYRKAEIALETFCEAMCQGADVNKCRYYPYFNIKDGFSYSGSDIFIGYSFLAARLLFPNKETAEHAGNCMKEYYKIYLTTRL